MNEGKMRAILESLQGITYLEWKKLRFTIEQNFKAEASNKANKMPIAGPDELIEFYKHSF